MSSDMVGKRGLEHGGCGPFEQGDGPFVHGWTKVRPPVQKPLFSHYPISEYSIMIFLHFLQILAGIAEGFNTLYKSKTSPSFGNSEIL